MITDFLDFIQEWLNSGVYGFFTDAVAYMIEMSVLGYLKLLNFAIPFAWGVAKTILEDLNLSTYINAAFDELPSMSRDILTALKIPECINTAISGYVTRFVLKFVPGV